MTQPCSSRNLLLLLLVVVVKASSRTVEERYADIRRAYESEEEECLGIWNGEEAQEDTLNCVRALHAQRYIVTACTCTVVVVKRNLA